MAKQLIAAGEQVPAAQLIIQAHEAAKQEHREAEMKLDAHKERVTTMNKLHHESSTEKEMNWAMSTVCTRMWENQQ
jgi:hypothetical protein